MWPAFVFLSLILLNKGPRAIRITLLQYIIVLLLLVVVNLLLYCNVYVKLLHRCVCIGKT